MITPRPPTPLPESTPPDPLPPGAMLRAAADGELSVQQQALLEDHLRGHPQDAQRIEFEQHLRAACRRVLTLEMGQSPAALRARIATVVAGRPTGVETPAPVAMLLRRWRPLAAAAAILLCLSAVYMVVLGEPAPISWPSGQPRLVGFMSREHQRCARTEAALRGKLSVSDLDATPERFAGLLGHSLTVPAVESAGFEFLGAGPCAVPGRGSSVHFMFRATRGVDPAVAAPDNCRIGERLSMFIQADTGDIPMEAGRTYTLESASGPRVLAWIDNGLIYYLVTDSRDAAAASLAAMKLPLPGGTL